MPCLKCGDSNCDSVFHKGDRVKVLWGGESVFGKISIDMRTSVVVEFEQTILYLKETVTATTSRTWWGGRKVVSIKVSEERILKAMTFGAAHVHFRE